MILLDSSCWVEALRQRGDRMVQDAVRTWLEQRQLAITAPILAEVLRGVPKPDVQRVRRTLDALHYLETRDEDWREVIRCARMLSDVAQHVPLIDLATAIVAHRNDVELAHRGRHYLVIATVVPVRLTDLH